MICPSLHYSLRDEVYVDIDLYGSQHYISQGGKLLNRNDHKVAEYCEIADKLITSVESECLIIVLVQYTLLASR